ncbi:hypothetical protein HGI30_16995 [Paenibacillus albicereus]|uniref:Uncharacterized protein n=1 Tax=Paenibacillus albicereus TaxID=2726185 RepID=A0A6H2H0C5_9BACL|nr:hypothetical protein [Paenibacillus albicereus]QJC53102.1 hypothetical protein HGI30_16995 [Paenibacillus albicereus]
MSSGTSLALIIAFLLVVFVFVSKSNGSKAKAGRGAAPRSQASIRRDPVAEAGRETEGWERLGALPDAPVQDTLAKLERALPADYVDRLRQRYLTEHPECSLERFELLLLELKRYFVLCSLLRSVPMFSDEVDGVWHEMLMYTRDYERFGRELTGGPLHHEPAAESVPDPGGRAWFDLAYAALFRFHAFAPVAWGGFFRHPLDEERLRRLQDDEERELRSALIRPEADERLASYLLDKLRRQAAEVREERSADRGRSSSPAAASSYADPGYGAMLGGAMLLSSMGGSFDEQMEQHLPEEERQRSQSSCSASGCASGGSYDEGGSGRSDSGSGGGSSDGGSSSSCSSGSSCSSSSCGGGGD